MNWDRQPAMKVLTPTFIEVSLRLEEWEAMYLFVSTSLALGIIPADLALQTRRACRGIERALEPYSNFLAGSPPESPFSGSPGEGSKGV